MVGRGGELVIINCIDLIGCVLINFELLICCDDLIAFTYRTHDELFSSSKRDNLDHVKLCMGLEL